jgi:3-phosphoshikimate 1-carboxyvinyltransferase
MPAATIGPARCVRGRFRVPGDKSISHRYALLAAQAHGTSRLVGYSPGADCQSTLACLRHLGVETATNADGAVTIFGRGLNGLRSASVPLDAGNSGTTMRMLVGILAGQPFVSTLVGDASLSRRPMNRVIEPLEQMGARIEATNGHAPLIVHGGPLRPINYRPPVPSAQVKSAVLLAGLYANGVTSVTEPAETRDHTERALSEFGASVTRNGSTASVLGTPRLEARNLSVPGDFSSAAFWMVAAAALPGSHIEVENVGLNPTRTALIDVLRRFGATVGVHPSHIEGGEPRGSVLVEANEMRSVEILPAEVPGLIDELPALAALAAHHGEVTVRGAAELRVKESDRIATLVAGLRSLGIPADERPDGFTVHGSGIPAGGVAHAHDDHRIAMALAIAALGAAGPSTITGSEAVAISYPGFFETLERLTV